MGELKFILFIGLSALKKKKRQTKRRTPRKLERKRMEKKKMGKKQMSTRLDPNAHDLLNRVTNTFSFSAT